MIYIYIYVQLKENSCQRRILCPVKKSFENEGQIKTFSFK